MKIDRASYNNWHIEFLYSPLYEMFCSLHVLFSPEHHKYRESWAVELKSEMTVKLYDTLEFYHDLTNRWNSFMDFCDWNEQLNGFNVIAAINDIEGYKLEDYVLMIFENKLDRDCVRKLLAHNRIPIGVFTPSQMTFMGDVLHHKERLIGALKTYYYLHYQTIQLETEPYMIRTLQAHKSLSEHMDFLDYMDMLHPRIEIAEDRVSLLKYDRFDILFEKLRRVEIRISTFIDPHLLVNFAEDYLMLCIRAKMEKYENDVHEDLIQVMKAFGDKTRMRIIKYMYKNPVNTQELAIKLDISEAGVSKHLKVLFKANIIKKMRKGNYILYFLDQQTIDRVPMNIYQYLDD